jgi:anti-sigma B factor antagonist
MFMNMEVVGDVGVIRVRGEVDLLEAPRLDEVAQKMLGDGAHTLVIDLDGVPFMDSSGLRVLIEAHRRAHAQGGTVTVRHPSRFIHSLLQLTGLDQVLLVDGVGGQSQN